MKYTTFTPRVGGLYQCQRRGCLTYKQGDTIRIEKVVPAINEKGEHSGVAMIPKSNKHHRLMPTHMLWKKI